MVRNLSERWLLATVGVRRVEWRCYLAVLGSGIAPDEVDLAAQLGGYKLAKRRVRHDLPALFDQLHGPGSHRVHAVVYGRRRFRRPVILAAALHQAGVSPSSYAAAVHAGCRTLRQIQKHR